MWIPLRIERERNMGRLRDAIIAAAVVVVVIK